MKKVVLIVGVVLVVAVAAGVYYLFSNLNSLVAQAIETHGSEATETSVNVSGVDIALREGRASISGLQIGSPEGFDVTHVFVLGDITVDLDVESVRDDPIVIDEVTIRAPVVNVEVLKDGSSNVDELRKRLQSGGSAKGDAGSQKNIRIKRFVFEQGRIEVDASALGVEKRTITLPAIRINDVGGSNGAPPDQIARLILNTAAKNTASEIAKSEVNRLIKEQLGESLSDKAKGLLEKLGD